MKTAFRKTVVIALTDVAFGTLLSVIYLDEHFYYTRPREPEPKAGRIYPEWIHGGTRVYLTRVETLPFELSWYVCAVSAVTAYLLNQRWKALRGPGEGLPKKLS
jgi:hypothetical protein